MYERMLFENLDFDDDRDVAASDCTILSFFSIAAWQGHLAVVTKLIAAGADVNKARTDDGSTPLFMAAEKGHLTVVTKLIAAGALVDKAETDDGTTPLYIAAQRRCAFVWRRGKKTCSEGRRELG